MAFMSSETFTQFNSRLYKEHMERFSSNNYITPKSYLDILNEDEKFLSSIRQKKEKSTYRIPFIYPIA